VIRVAINFLLSRPAKFRKWLGRFVEWSSPGIKSQMISGGLFPAQPCPETPCINAGTRKLNDRLTAVEQIALDPIGVLDSAS
jgi:hypothetical protein